MNSERSHPNAVIICPGIHHPQLTQDFLEGLQRGANSNLSTRWTEQLLIFPAQDYPAYSAAHLLEFLRSHTDLLKAQIVFISFSAGVAGAIAAAWGWQLLGGKVKAFIALDGWGVPLYGNFPIYRLSHDYFTHWSSALLGVGEDSFYADPSVEHLDLWQLPDICQGWWIHSSGVGNLEQRTFTTAADFVTQLLQDYT